VLIRLDSTNPVTYRYRAMISRAQGELIQAAFDEEDAKRWAGKPRKD
jgi:hypothetical protein